MTEISIWIECIFTSIYRYFTDCWQKFSLGISLQKYFWWSFCYRKLSVIVLSNNQRNTLSHEFFALKGFIERGVFIKKIFSLRKRSYSTETFLRLDKLSDSWNYPPTFVPEDSKQRANPEWGGVRHFIAQWTTPYNTLLVIQ